MLVKILSKINQNYSYYIPRCTFAVINVIITPEGQKLIYEDSMTAPVQVFYKLPSVIHNFVMSYGTLQFPPEAVLCTLLLNLLFWYMIFVFFCFIFFIRPDNWKHDRFGTVPIIKYFVLWRYFKVSQLREEMTGDTVFMYVIPFILVAIVFDVPFQYIVPRDRQFSCQADGVWDFTTLNIYLTPNIWFEVYITEIRQYLIFIIALSMFIWVIYSVKTGNEYFKFTSEQCVLYFMTYTFLLLTILIKGPILFFYFVFGMLLTCLCELYGGIIGGKIFYPPKPPLTNEEKIKEDKKNNTSSFEYYDIKERVNGVDVIHGDEESYKEKSTKALLDKQQKEANRLGVTLEEYKNMPANELEYKKYLKAKEIYERDYAFRTWSALYFNTYIWLCHIHFIYYCISTGFGQC